VCAKECRLFARICLSSLLFNVNATDPATFALVALILMAVALVASFIPAYRATRGTPLMRYGKNSPV
jgi:ABC-type lipoprotein release transport system permease subunit